MKLPPRWCFAWQPAIPWGPFRRGEGRVGYGATLTTWTRKIGRFSHPSSTRANNQYLRRCCRSGHLRSLPLSVSVKFMRHAVASLFIQYLGWTPKRLQTVMGHSSITMTFDLYGRMFENVEIDRADMAKIEAAEHAHRAREQ